MQESWISLSDAALRLKMSYHRTMRLAHIGEIEARKRDNGRWEIKRESLTRLVNERSETPQAAHAG